MHDPNTAPQGDIIPEGPMLADAPEADRFAAFGFATGTAIEQHLAVNPLPPELVMRSLAITFASALVQFTNGASKSRRRFLANRFITSALSAVADSQKGEQGGN